MITLKDVHNSFDTMQKMPLFEIETTGGYDVVNISKSKKGLIAFSEHGTFESLYDEFDYCVTSADLLDMMLSDLYVKVIEKHCQLGILV